MKIIKTKGQVISYKNLSKTAREIYIHLDDKMDIIAGCFVNIFMDINGEKIRRAYSISSDPKYKKDISLSIRSNPAGKMSPLFWMEDNELIGMNLDIMGPLGLNTADKFSQKKLFLMAFGIGVSVIKAILHEVLEKEKVDEIYILTGSRKEEEILYGDIFNRQFHKKIVSVKHVVSNPIDKNYPYMGYIKNHITEYDFNNADIYICGMAKACNSLEGVIRNKGCDNSNFFIEGFH